MVPVALQTTCSSFKRHLYSLLAMLHFVACRSAQTMCNNQFCAQTMRNSPKSEACKLVQILNSGAHLSAHMVHSFFSVPYETTICIVTIWWLRKLFGSTYYTISRFRAFWSVRPALRTVTTRTSTCLSSALAKMSRKGILSCELLIFCLLCSSCLRRS